MKPISKHFREILNLKGPIDPQELSIVAVLYDDKLGPYAQKRRIKWRLMRRHVRNSWRIMIWRNVLARSIKSSSRMMVRSDIGTRAKVGAIRTAVERNSANGQLDRGQHESICRSLILRLWNTAGGYCEHFGLNEAHSPQAASEDQTRILNRSALCGDL